jgi:hypothetical protein
MKNNFFNIIVISIAAIFFFTGCGKKNDTDYHADPNQAGLGIFSNKGNNLLTCFVGGKPWRTKNRYLYSISTVSDYEVRMDKNITGAATDTLVISWEGYFEENHQLTGNILLYLAVPSNLSFTNFSGFQGQRIKIDSAANGYFVRNFYGANSSSVKGNGNIYFNTANLDSIAKGIDGRLSGLFDADFDSVKITNGRFDHSITARQVNF